ncbi:hypothetical protein OUM94_004718, partial [Escherichia coli]|nr:hypothetical protein [Escherichia coli]
KHSGTGTLNDKANNVATDASGQSVVSFFTTDAGDYVMLFKVTGTSGTTDNGQTAKFTFTSVTKSGEAAALMKKNNQVVAESSGKTKNIITLQYEAANEAQANSKPQTKATITVTPKNGASSSDYGLVQQGEVTLTWNGNKATADVDFWSKKKGDYAITIDVTVNGAAKPKTRGVTASFRPDTSDVRITLQNGGDTKVAAGTSRTLTATLKDKYDNLIDDGTLAFSITKKVEGGQEAQLSNPTVTVGSSGTATTSFTPYWAGISPKSDNYTLQATYTSAAGRPSNTSGKPATQNYSVTGNVNEPKITVTAGQNNQTTSDGGVYNTATVKLTDTWGNPIAGTVNVSTTKQSGQTCGDADVNTRSLSFTDAGAAQTAQISATQAGDYNAVFTSQPGNKQAQETLGMAFIAQGPVLEFTRAGSGDVSIGTSVQLTATVKDSGSAKQCPVPDVPVTFTAMPHYQAKANQNSVYHTVNGNKTATVNTNASGVAQVNMAGQQAWTWKTKASVSVNSSTAEKYVDVIGVETAKTQSGSRMFVGSTWPVTFGNGSLVSNYSHSISDSNLYRTVNSTTFGYIPRVGKNYQTSITFTNQSTNRTITVNPPTKFFSMTKWSSSGAVTGSTGDYGSTYNADKTISPNKVVNGKSCSNGGDLISAYSEARSLFDKTASITGEKGDSLYDGLSAWNTLSGSISVYMDPSLPANRSISNLVVPNGSTAYCSLNLTGKKASTAFRNDQRVVAGMASINYAYLAAWAKVPDQSGNGAYREVNAGKKLYQQPSGSNFLSDFNESSQASNSASYHNVSNVTYGNSGNYRGWWIGDGGISYKYPEAAAAWGNDDTYSSTARLSCTWSNIAVGCAMN